MAELDKMIKVVVLCVPNSERSIPLENVLTNSGRFEIIKFSAVMYERKMTQYTPNFDKQKVLYGRILSNGEIGCTISHQLIQKKYMIQERPVVVLEDDARIPSLNNFEKLIEEFVDKHGDENAVLSLLPWNSQVVDNVSEADPSITRLAGNPPLTVGYIITPKAMAAVSAVNSDYSYLPDWPPTETSFYVTKKGVINHGDHATISLIDKTGRIKTGKLSKALRFTFIPYLLNRKFFSNFAEYFSFAIKPSFTWRVDRLKIR
jgi:hypothetical protein